MSKKNTELVLVQTKIDEKLRDLIAKKAKEEGITLAAFVRRALIRTAEAKGWSW